MRASERFRQPGSTQSQKILWGVILVALVALVAYALWSQARVERGVERRVEDLRYRMEKDRWDRLDGRGGESE